MPNRETSDPQQAPAGRNGQRSALLRVAIVVGLPILSVVLRLPIWFTLLLMLGLAVFLFLTPHFPKKEETPDPRKAWTQLMASCVRLQAAYDALKRTPSDEVARKRFLTSEQACLSLLNSHADTDWGPDSEYAAKVRNEIAALSAKARAECADLPPAPALIVGTPGEASGQGPPSGDGAAAAQAGRPSSPAAPDTTTSAELQGLLQTSEGTAVQIGSPAPTAEPEPPPAATEQSMTPATEGAVLQPDIPAPAATPETQFPAGRQVSTPASGATAMQLYAPAPPVQPEVPASAEKEGAAGKVAAAQSGTPAPPAKPEVPPAAKEQEPTPAGETIALPPSTSAPLAPPAVPVPTEKESAAAASGAAAAQPETPAPPALPEVPTPAEEQGLAPVSEAVAVQPDTSRPPAEPEVPPAAEKQGSTPAGESVAVQPGGSSPSAKLDVSGPVGRRLTPFLWLSGGVEEAAAFYVSVFKNSRVVGTGRYPEASRAKAWSVMTATVSLDGQELMLLNGGSVYKPPDTFQLLVRCADQAEIDYYWERLLAGGGEENAAGWLKDRFGVSWQVIPDALMELLIDPDPQRVARATEAMLEMRKIDIAGLREAADRL